MNTQQNAAQGRLVTGLFPDRASAESAFNAAGERGYTQDDVNLVMSDEARAQHFGAGETELGNKAAEGAGVGGAIGGTLGGVAAAIAAIGTSLAIPGLGLIVAGGAGIAALKVLPHAAAVG